MPRRSKSRTFSFKNLTHKTTLRSLLTRSLHGLVIFSMLAPNMAVLAASGSDVEAGADLAETTQIELEDFMPGVQAAGQDIEQTAVDSAESDYTPPRFEHPEPRQVQRGDNLDTQTSPLRVDACQAGGDLVLATGEECSLAAGSHTYDSILVQDSGTLYMEGNTTTGEGVTVTVDTFTVDSGGLVTADGEGYSGGSGPGTAASSGLGQGSGGGAHGGHGGNSTTAGGTAYDDVYFPQLLGSGGGHMGSSGGGTGGGAIQLDVDGTITINGTISANGTDGADSTYGGSGGGAGGSVTILAGTLAGSGLMRANGGVGGHSNLYSDGGGGGGGRIAVDAAASTFTGTLQAFGGSGQQYGGPGTLYWADSDSLMVNNNNHNGEAAGLVQDTYTFNSIQIAGYGHLDVLGTGSVLNLANDTVSMDGTATLTVYGTVNLPFDFSISGYTLDVQGLAAGALLITVEDGGHLILRAYTPLVSGEHVFGSVTVNNGGNLELVSYNNGDTNYLNDLAFELDCDNLTINTGGTLTTNGRGYSSGSGPGTASASGSGQGSGGGAHGGQGGSSTTAGGQANDDVYAPVLLGSGGGNRGNAAGGAGGGSIQLIVDNTLVVDGTITANGTGGSESYGGSGGGAGGSILIEAGTLTGTGLIRANGGTGGYSSLYTDGGGGGGGRVSLDITTNTFTGSVQAYGGGGQQYGGPGTIYYTADDALFVDNNGHNGRFAGLVEGTYSFTGIELANFGHLALLGTGSTVDLSSAGITGDGTAQVRAYGTVTGPVIFSPDGYTLDVLGSLTGVTDLEIEIGGLILHAYTPLYSGTFTFGDLSVQPGGTLELVSYDNGDTNYDNDLMFQLQADSIYVGSGGLIHTDGNGYSGGSGPGTAAAAGSGQGAGGGAHGGDGGDSSTSGGTAYDDIYMPQQLGSGGGDRGSASGGYGGGGIYLDVAQTLTLVGTISANGGDGGESYGGSGGGAGGMILIETGTLAGSGQIRAHGGDGGHSNLYNDGGGGGGGRIAVYAETNTFSGTIVSAGGTGYNAGEAGSIYLDTLDPSLSTVDIEPASVTVNGADEGTITVTLLSAVGSPVSGEPVEVALAYGEDLYLNGSLVSLNEYVEIGTSDTNGEVTATITALTTGQRTLKARSDDITIDDMGEVAFIAGPVDADVSQVESDLFEVPADGSSEATITVTVMDAQGNPIEGASVILNADGDAVVTQPTETTNVNGQTTGTVSDSTAETVMVSAVANSIPLTETVEIDFAGADLAVSINAAAETAPGGALVYSLSVQNLGALPAEDVTLNHEIPDSVTFLSHTGPSEPAQDGNTYTWSLDTLYESGQVGFAVTVLVDPSTTVGTVLSSTLTGSTTSPDQDSGNDTDSVDTTVVDAYVQSTAITPSSQTLHLGSTVTYTVRITNEGLLADSYDLSQSGLDSAWVTWSDTRVSISAGGFRDVTLEVTITDCLTQTSMPFSVTVDSVNGSGSDTVYADLQLEQAPQIFLDAPGSGSTSGSRSVLFKWRTTPASTGLLTVYPEGSPGEAQTFNTGEASNHAVFVEDLERYETYEWTVEADSACGTAASAARSVEIGSGIVFISHSPHITIDRDYNQQVSVSVKNEDTEAHTLTASVLNPYNDLIVNFVGSGSIDETITLQAGETRALTLGVHAQDAASTNYDLTAHLVADEAGTPSEDNAVLHLTVLAEGDFSITEGSLDPVTLGQNYTITNNGQTITDLAIGASDPASGEPASVLIQPGFTHALLESGESLDVTVYPIYSAGDESQYVLSLGAHLASFTADTVSDIPYELEVSGAGETQTYTSAATCSGDNEIYAVVLEDCTSEFPVHDWYCTNRPEISTPIELPHFLNEDSVDEAYLKMEFSPHDNVQRHNGQVYFNGEEIGSFTDAIPSGTYTYNFSPGTLNTALAGTATQNIEMHTQHYNFGHYVSATDYTLGMHVSEAVVRVCASSAAAALASVDATYECEAIAVLPWDEYIHDESSDNMADCSDSIVCEEEGGAQGTQEDDGDPINVHTGSFSYSNIDLSFTVSSGELLFMRSYSSGAAERIDEVLGVGWTHNHNTRLILPDDPGGEEGFLIHRGVSGNDLLFKIEEDGSFTAGPGITAELTYEEGPPAAYTLVTMYQSTLVFDEDGLLIERLDEQGRAFDYTYDGENRLTTISADSGSRSLTLAYNEDDLISTVTDHSGRIVSFAYDANGDLVSTTDVLGQEWTYAYDSEHRMTEVVDPRGIDTVTTEYDLQGRAWRQFDGLGNMMVEITFNTDGSSTVYDGLGRATTYEYDNRNTMIAATDPLGGETARTYDDSFRPDTITDASGSTTTLTWDDEGYNLTAVVDAEGSQTDLAYDSQNNLTSVTDPLGYLTTYEYNGMLLTGSTDALNNESSYTYTAEGFLESVTDPLGHTTTYTYDSWGQLTSTTDHQGHTSTFTYDDLGRMTDSTGVNGTVTHNEYDAAGRLISVTSNYDPARPQNDEGLYNIVTGFEYDEVGSQTAVTDTFGRTTHYTYDNAGRLTSTTNPVGNQTTNTYDVLGQLVSTTDVLGRTTRFYYDSAGRLWKTVDALGNATATSYNTDGSVASTTDALGHTTSYTYDDLGRVIATTDAVGHSTTSSYDSNGRLVATTDAMGHTTSYEYDALGRMISQTDPAGGVTENFYDAAGNLVQSVDPEGNAATYSYDSLGRLISVTDALGGSTTYTYNAEGQRTSMTDPEGNTTSYAYDALGRQISTTDALGHTSTTTYNALGQVAASTDVLGRTTTYTYNTLGRLVSQVDPAGGETTYAYDAVGNQISYTDPNGATTVTTYDALNRPRVVVDPNGSSTTTTYNAVGNVVSSRDALGNTTSFSYDALGRQTAVTDPLGHTTSYSYDANGNRTSRTDANGVVTAYEYDNLGRLTAVIENYKPGFGADEETNVRTEYSYDANGNRLTIEDANTNLTSFSYDARNRLTRESDALGNTWSYAYDSAGNQVSMTDANGATTAYDYDDLGRLTGIDYPGSTDDVTFNYNAAGMRTSMQDGAGTTSWDYDTLGRTTSVNDPFGDTVGYSYDSVGNRTGQTYPDGKTVSYAYDSGGRLTGVTDWQSMVTEYSHDANGQVTEVSLPNGVTSSYSYDDAGRLLEIEHTAGEERLSSFSYTYDNAGNRTRAEEFYLTTETGPTVEITVFEGDGQPMAGVPVYAFDGETYTGFNDTTDAEGKVSITLPEGEYRFRADVDGTQFWSDEENHCSIPGCMNVTFTIPLPVLVPVQNTGAEPMAELPVYAFEGETYSGFNGTTDENGEVSLRLPEGDYRFRADYNGTQFWSGEIGHCQVPGCTLAPVTVTVPVVVSVLDTMGMPIAELPVYAFDDTTYTGYHGTTDEYGEVEFTLPEGSYRFRADYKGTQFWSGESNTCEIPGCLTDSVTITLPVTVTVSDTDGLPQEGLPVYAFEGTTYTGFHTTTDENGEAAFTLPEGDYRFRTDLNGTQFWSGEENTCPIPGCIMDAVTVSIPLTVTVSDTDGTPQQGLPVYAFDGTTYTGKHGTTDVNGEFVLTLPLGSYRFRSDLNGTQFWSGETNHCDVPDCLETAVTVSIPLTVTVEDGEGDPLESVPVYAFDESVYTGYHGTSDAYGEVDLTLPLGSYRFRADYEGEQYWSGVENHCDVPGCLSVVVVAGDEVTPTSTSTPTSTTTATPTATATFTPTPEVQDTPTLTATATDTAEPQNTNTPTSTATASSTPEPTATPSETPTATETSSAYLSGQAHLASLNRMPAEAPLLDENTVTVTVSDTDSTPQEGLPVYAFDGTTYSGIHSTTDEYGEVNLTLPDGSYRFRADLNGTQFWSGEENHCTVPECTEAAVTVTIPVTLTVSDTEANLQEGLPVYAFDDGTYTNYSGTTDEYGEVVLTLPEGEYRFRADLNGTQFWSGETNHCDVPGCDSAAVVVSIPVTITVTDTDSNPQEGLPVYAFDEAAYTGYNGTTDENGEVAFTLPEGSYHFRSDLNGTQFWSGETNHCTLPGCTEAAVTVTIPVTVTVQSTGGEPYPDLPVYAFDGDTYTGHNGTSDENGHLTFTLPEGSYHFRADYDGVPFWSDDENHCTLPGCIEAVVEIPSGMGEVVVTIDYTYDSLYRLTAADYENGTFFHYTYDAVGNRLTEETQDAISTYTYDIANRLIDVDGTTYTWDANGNLLADGTSTYTYDAANRLVSLSQGEDTYAYIYNGLGDRLSQTINGDTINYTLDINRSLTQVLADGTNTYLYGQTRIGEEQPEGWHYHLADALGSVRQLTDANMAITLAQSYTPFGETLFSAGDGETEFEYAGEIRDSYIKLIYLRSRYYSIDTGRFLTKDVWDGDYTTPMSYNRWLYVNANPVNYVDPSGRIPVPWEISSGRKLYSC